MDMDIRATDENGCKWREHEKRAIGKALCERRTQANADDEHHDVRKRSREERESCRNAESREHTGQTVLRREVVEFGARVCAEDRREIFERERRERKRQGGHDCEEHGEPASRVRDEDRKRDPNGEGEVGLDDSDGRPCNGCVPVVSAHRDSREQHPRKHERNDLPDHERCDAERKNEGERDRKTRRIGERACRENRVRDRKDARDEPGFGRDAKR